MPTVPPLCIFQGTTTFNNVSIKGALTVADMKEIGSETGVLQAANRSPAEVVAAYSPTTTELPVTPMSGHYLQTFYQFDKIDMFKVTHKDNSAFDPTNPAMKITAAGVIPEPAAGKVYAVLAQVYLAPSSSSLGQIYAGFSGHLSYLPPLVVGQQMLLILRPPTTPGVSPIKNFNVDFYYRYFDDTTCYNRFYGWQAEDVTLTELSNNYNIFLGEYSTTVGLTSYRELLDAGDYYTIMTISALASANL